MNKKLSILSLILAMLFVSCKNPLNFKQDAKESQKAYISISANLPGSNARTVLPNVVTDTTTGLTWELTGEITDSGSDKTFEKSWSDTEDKTAYQQMIYPDADSGILLDVGNWKFTLTVYNTEGKVLEATLGDENNPIQITKDGENKLEFVMQEATGENLANGQIEFTLKFPENVVGQVEATLNKITISEDNEILEEPFDSFEWKWIKGNYFSEVTYNYPREGVEKTLLPSSYKLIIKLQQQNGNQDLQTINTYSCIIRVAPGLLSSGSYELERLTQLYSITYGYKNLESGLEYALNEFVEGNITTTFDEFTEFVLPTPIVPAGYEDYEFDAWYTDSTYADDKRIESTTYQISAPTSLYAKWKLKEEVVLPYAIATHQWTENGGLYTQQIENAIENIEDSLKISGCPETITNPSDVWTYFISAKPDEKSIGYTFEEGNNTVTLQLKSDSETVVGVAAARADMFFTVGTEWKTYTFETGYLAETMTKDITIGAALSDTPIYLRNIKVEHIENSTKENSLPTLSFYIKNGGIASYLGDATKPKNIIEVTKTSSNDGYQVTLNTDIEYVDLTIRDYATSGLNKTSFNISLANTSDTLQTAMIGASVDANGYKNNPKVVAWTTAIPESGNLAVYFPAYANNEDETLVPCAIEGILSGGNVSSTMTIKNIKTEKIDSLEETGKVFAIKTQDTWQTSMTSPFSQTMNIPANTTYYFDVLIVDRFEDSSNINWSDCTRFLYSTSAETTSDGKFYYSAGKENDNDVFKITNNTNESCTCKITLTENFTVQIEEVTTTGGTTAGGEDVGGITYASLPNPEGNGSIDTFYISDLSGLKTYRDLINGTKGFSLSIQPENGTSYTRTFDPSPTSRYDVILNSDITITDAWTPIGTRDYPFTSSFDGQGHSITINSCADVDYAGVFGYVGNQSASTTSISNLVVKGPDAGITTSAQYAGGIVAYSYGATISNCVNKLKIDASASSTGYLGGIVGYTKKETIISSCANFAELVSTSSIGGIVGFADVENNYSPLSIDKCINIGSIKGSSNGNYVSGILGRTATATTISNCINFGERGCNGGPFPLNHSGVATVTDSGNLTISNCINAGPYANIYDSASIAIAYGNIIESSYLYYNKDNWYYDNFGSQEQGNVEDTCTVSGLSTEDFFDSSKCVLVADDNWSCVTDKPRYPLPDLSSVFTDNTIWQEICDVAKVEVSSGGGEEEIIQNAYYVSAIGSDANDGKTTDTSFATLEHALSKITDEYRTIYIVGTYYGQNEAYNSATWIDTSVGTQESPIQIIGYPDSNPELSQNGEKRVLYISEDSYLILKNISIVGGNTSQSGAAIYFYANGQLTLENCTLSGNESTSGISGFDSLYHNGITLSGNSSLIVKNSVIENNIVLDSASDDSTSVTFTGSSEIKGNVILNSDSTNIILENDITVSGTIYIATGIIPEPAITITSALTKHSSDNKISVSYQDFTKALSTKCISLGEGVSSDEISKFMLTDESYVISTDGKISTNN